MQEYGLNIGGSEWIIINICSTDPHFGDPEGCRARQERSARQSTSTTRQKKAYRNTWRTRQARYRRYRSRGDREGEARGDGKVRRGKRGRKTDDELRKIIADKVGDRSGAS